MLKLSTKRTYDAAFSGENSVLAPHHSPLKKPKTLICDSLSCSPRSPTKETFFPPSGWNIDDVDPQKWLEWLPAPHRRRLLHYYYQKQRKFNGSINDENATKTNFESATPMNVPPLSSTAFCSHPKDITYLNKKIDDIHLHNNSPTRSYTPVSESSNKKDNNINVSGSEPENCVTSKESRLPLFESLPKPDQCFAKNERIFTIEDVKEIIQRAVTERENELRDEYDRILAERLQEQHYQFTLWSRDFFERSCKNKDKDKESDYFYVA